MPEKRSKPLYIYDFTQAEKKKISLDTNGTNINPLFFTSETAKYPLDFNIKLSLLKANSPFTVGNYILELEESEELIECIRYHSPLMIPNWLMKHSRYYMIDNEILDEIEEEYEDFVEDIQYTREISNKEIYENNITSTMKTLLRTHTWKGQFKNKKAKTIKTKFLQCVGSNLISKISAFTGHFILVCTQLPDDCHLYPLSKVKTYMNNSNFKESVLFSSSFIVCYNMPDDFDLTKLGFKMVTNNMKSLCKPWTAPMLVDNEIVSYMSGYSNSYFHRKSEIKNTMKKLEEEDKEKNEDHKRHNCENNMMIVEQPNSIRIECALNYVKKRKYLKETSDNIMKGHLKWSNDVLQNDLPEYVEDINNKSLEKDELMLLTEEQRSKLKNKLEKYIDNDFMLQVMFIEITQGTLKEILTSIIEQDDIIDNAISSNILDILDNRKDYKNSMTLTSNAYSPIDEEEELFKDLYKFMGEKVYVLLNRKITLSEKEKKGLLIRLKVLKGNINTRRNSDKNFGKKESIRYEIVCKWINNIVKYSIIKPQKNDPIFSNIMNEITHDIETSLFEEWDLEEYDEDEENVELLEPLRKYSSEETDGYETV
jgi:hypothetical protein